MNSKISLSIICPVYNEEKSIKIFYNNLIKAIKSCKKIRKYEVLFINNNSEDNSLSILKEIRKKDNIKIISFSRNFGYQASIQCGLKYAINDFITFIDTDGEDPPEILIKLINKISDENSIVYGERVDRHENFILKNLRKVFYFICKHTADIKMVMNMSEFLVFHKKMKKYLINNNTNPFLRFEIANLGFKRQGVPYKRIKRIDGKSSYNLIGIFKFAITGYLTSSTFPLRLNFYFFLLLILLNLIFFLRSLNLILLININLLFICFAITIKSLYLARIYRNTEKRPQFIIDEMGSFGVNIEKN